MTSALAQPAVSPLGTIRLASFVTNGSGSGKGRLRHYPSYALVCLLEGLGYYRDSTGYSQSVVPGDLIWVSPRVTHSYGPQEGHFWNEFFLVFDGPIFDLWESRKMFQVLRPVQHLGAAALWVERLTKVCQHLDQNSKQCHCCDRRSPIDFVGSDLAANQNDGTSRRVAGFGGPSYRTALAGKRELTANRRKIRVLLRDFPKKIYAPVRGLTTALPDAAINAESYLSSQ